MHVRVPVGVVVIMVVVFFFPHDAWQGFDGLLYVPVVLE
jgi:hypothetical protein